MSQFIKVFFLLSLVSTAGFADDRPCDGLEDSAADLSRARVDRGLQATPATSEAEQAVLLGARAANMDGSLADGDAEEAAAFFQRPTAGGQRLRVGAAVLLGAITVGAGTYLVPKTSPEELRLLMITTFGGLGALFSYDLLRKGIRTLGKLIEPQTDKIEAIVDRLAWATNQRALRLPNIRRILGVGAATDLLPVTRSVLDRQEVHTRHVLLQFDLMTAKLQSAVDFLRAGRRDLAVDQTLDIIADLVSTYRDIVGISFQEKNKATDRAAQARHIIESRLRQHFFRPLAAMNISSTEQERFFSALEAKLSDANLDPAHPDIAIGVRRFVEAYLKKVQI